MGFEGNEENPGDVTYRTYQRPRGGDSMKTCQLIPLGIGTIGSPLLRFHLTLETPAVDEGGAPVQECWAFGRLARALKNVLDKYSVY